nr:MAG TPA: hypothetical protein [Ackermannviridae sp.]DAR64536.1 MAG TPA: hypothetical protein [Caudoviricetes sp.]
MCTVQQLIFNIGCKPNLDRLKQEMETKHKCIIVLDFHILLLSL